VWCQLNYGAGNTRTEDAEITGKALFAPLVPCDKNLSLRTYGPWETRQFYVDLTPAYFRVSYDY